MNRKEFVQKIETVVEDRAVREQLETVYGKVVPEVIVKILSLSSAPMLFDENESRTLSVCEILNAEKDLHVPFRTNGIVPIADIGNNDYIVYQAEKRNWCIYNILDETLYDEAASFEELFLNP